MMKRSLFILLSAALLAFNNAEAGYIAENDINASIEQLLSAEHKDGEIIVRFKDKTAGAQLKAHSKTGAVIKKRFRGIKGLQLLSLPRNLSVKAALRSYLKDRDVEYAEPNYIVHSTQTPDDPDFSRLWGLHNTGQTGGTFDADIDAVEAWDITTGSHNVVIAVVDSGVALNSNISTGHPELTNNIWTNPGETDCFNNVDDDGNGYKDDCYGWDFLDNDNDPMDYNGHGSHVSGTIAAVGNNSQGITGVMWDASIMPLRFLDAAGSGYTSGAISAILYANANGAHVINNSWGGGGFSQALEDAINAVDAVVVCAAGNDGMDNDSTPFYPASYTSANIISVAATDKNDNLAWFSNYGASSVDIAAPGVSIYSTLPARNQIFSDNMSNLDNWTADPPWGLSSVSVSPPYSASDSPDGDYSNKKNISLELNAPLTLSGERGTALQYWLALETEPGYDFLFIEASINGNKWSNLNYWSGSTGYYFYFREEDITSYDGLENFYIRFRLDTDRSITYDGAYIDDVNITSYSDTYTGTEFAYYQGTSMAAPHVSGVAGLITAFNPGLSAVEVIDIILNSADIKSQLTGKVASDGRLNAYSALCPPVRIMETSSEFSTLQAAYDAAGDGNTVLSHDRIFTEDINMNVNKSVTLEGGYDCDFTEQIGITTLNGNITITAGTLIIGDFIVE